MTPVRHLILGAAALAGLVLARPAAGQVSPDADWRTLRTPHFRVYFTPPTEQLARRIAAQAETAYVRLSRELKPPRGVVELVVSDDVDFSNGATTFYPTNRIVVYAFPPVDVLHLRGYGDWGELVVTHELTHAFHLDRSRGVWGTLQRIFGRVPLFFPAAYEPSWLAEGLAVYYESRLTGHGRLAGPAHRAFARAAAAEDVFPAVSGLSSSSSRFPGGTAAYVYGSLLFEQLAATGGADKVGQFVDRMAGGLPFLINRQARRSFGSTFDAAWRAIRDSARAAAGPSRPPLPEWRPVLSGWQNVEPPRWRDSTLLVTAGSGKEVTEAYAIDASGRRTRLGRRDGGGPNVPLPGGGLLFAQYHYDGPYQVRSDLYVQRGNDQRRLTDGARLTQPDARGDGEIVAVHGMPGTTVVVRVSADGRRIQPLVAPSLDVQWASPRWSPRGEAIVAVRISRGGRSSIVTLDTLGTTTRVLADEWGSVSVSPSFLDDTTVMFASDRSGTLETYLVGVRSFGAEIPAPGRLSDAATELADPESGRGAAAGRVAAVRLGGRGYELGVGRIAADSFAQLDTVRAIVRIPLVGDTLPAPVAATPAASRYRPWRTLLPHYWLPDLEFTSTVSRVGFYTSGEDAVQRHVYALGAFGDLRSSEHGGSLIYEYAGLGVPVLQLAAEQDWTTYDQILTTAGDSVGELRRRATDVDGNVVFPFPGFRRAASLSVGGSFESRAYRTEPESLRALLRPVFGQTLRRYGVHGIVAATNVKRPMRSISPEDGFAGSAAAEWFTTRRRAERLDFSRFTGTLGAYRAFDLGGWAHHVLMLRGAGGVSGGGPADLAAGAGMGATLDESYVAGGDEFPVRGYGTGALLGDRVVAGSAEYRAPLAGLHSGIGRLPVFVDRAAIAIFADAATAWCADAASSGRCFSSDRAGHLWIGSVGADLGIAAAFPYDLPLTFHVGYAYPLPAAWQAEATRGFYTRLGIGHF